MKKNQTQNPATPENVTLTHIAQDISTAIGLPMSTTRDILALMVDRMSETLLSGRSLQIRGLGTIKPVQLKSRSGRNPATGESIQIPERRGLRFKPSADLMANLRDS